MKIPVEVWVQRYMRTEQTLVTRAVFTYVAVDQMGSPDPGASRRVRKLCGLGRYCSLPSLTDSGPEASVVSTGSLRCVTGMVFPLAAKRFCCFTRPWLDFRT